MFSGEQEENGRKERDARTAGCLYFAEELDTESAYTELLTELIQWDLECGCIREMSLRAVADTRRKDDPSISVKDKVEEKGCGGEGGNDSSDILHGWFLP